MKYYSVYTDQGDTVMIAIRQVEQSDVDLLSALQKEAFQPLWEKYHDSHNPYLRGPQDITSRLDSPLFHYYCILKNNELVGGILYANSDTASKEYYLQRLFIAPQHQHQGLARMAILLCEKEFEEAQIFTVDFPEDLDKNRRCYISAGFRDTGIREEIGSGIVLARFEKRMR